MSIVGSEQWMYSSGREFYNFPIEQSLRFNDNDNAKLVRTPASAGNQKTWTWSCWVKRGNLGVQQNLFNPYTGGDGSNESQFHFLSTDNIRIYDSGGNRGNVSTNAVFRDVSAWYHIVLRVDTTQATASDRIRIYVNGELQSLSGTQPSQNTDLGWNNTSLHAIGMYARADASPFDGYMAEMNHIDGQSLAPTSFGELKSGIWTPVDTADLTFGTNGFRLQFGDTTEASGFNAVTYTGNGSSQSISGVGFSSAPDMVWLKSRSAAYDHVITDSVRGVEKQIIPNKTDTESQDAGKGLTSFDSDGFTVTLGTSTSYNNSGQTYVAWAWDAGSGSPVSNTDGSITSTVKANTDYGFSIVSYAGDGTSGTRTIGCGLNEKPDVVILKNRTEDSVTDSWFVYHIGLGSSSPSPYLTLYNTDAVASSGVFVDTAFSDNGGNALFAVSGSYNGVNKSGTDYIAYCFAEKTGYSKFGTYSGTGAAGNSITLGFKPAFVMFKRTDSTSDWFMLDNTRDTSNPIDKKLEANTSGAEVVNAAYETDFNSDGFVLQNTNAQLNASGGTYIYMAFADTRDAAFWRDTSGEGNDWQPNNLVFSDVVPDSTTNNFGTWNPLVPTTGYTFSEGNLKALAGTADYGAAGGMFTPKTGKWYFEFCNSGNGGTTGRKVCGVASSQIVAGNDKQDPSIASGIEWSPTGGTAAIYAFRENGDKCSISATTAYGSDDAQTVGDVVGVALDLDNSAIYFSVNGVWQNSGDPTSGASQTGAAFTGLADDSYTIMMHQWEASHAWTHNGGQDSTFAGARAAGGNADENGYGDFAYAPPSGFLSLCSANLPTGAIDTLADETPEDYFNTVLYTGNSSTNAITGVGFQPDWTWIKNRSGANSHILHDVIRGNNSLSSNLTNAEINQSAYWNGFNADGFEVTGTVGEYNASGSTYASWNWKAGGTGVSNTDGSITSTVSVGATSQQNWFSISQYTGTGSSMTWGHGLGVKPDLFIVKKTNSADEWIVYPLGATGNLTQYLKLHTTSGYTSDSVLETANSSVLGFGSSGARNGSGDDYICYSFANAEGLCKAGSYVGNGSSTDGTFVYTGFRPSFLLVKNTSIINQVWLLLDAKRGSENVISETLEANNSNAESNNDRVDFVSNGFKWRNNYQNQNNSGNTYIYLAIAEQPFKFANAR